MYIPSMVAWKDTQNQKTNNNNYGKRPAKKLPYDPFFMFFFTDEMLVQYLSVVQLFAALLVALREGQQCIDIRS